MKKILLLAFAAVAMAVQATTIIDYTFPTKNTATAVPDSVTVSGNHGDCIVAFSGTFELRSGGIRLKTDNDIITVTLPVALADNDTIVFTWSGQSDGTQHGPVVEANNVMVRDTSSANNDRHVKVWAINAADFNAAGANVIRISRFGSKSVLLEGIKITRTDSGGTPDPGTDPNPGTDPQPVPNSGTIMDYTFPTNAISGVPTSVIVNGDFGDCIVAFSGTFELRSGGIRLKTNQDTVTINLPVVLAATDTMTFIWMGQSDGTQHGPVIQANEVIICDTSVVNGDERTKIYPIDETGFNALGANVIKIYRFGGKSVMLKHIIIRRTAAEEPSNPTSIDNVASVRYYDGIIFGTENTLTELYNVAGVLLFRTTGNIDLTGFANGTYIVRQGKAVLKIMR